MNYKIRVIDSIDHPKIFNCYKLSWRTTLTIGTNELNFDYMNRPIQIKDVQKVTTISHSSVRWICLEYGRSTSELKRLYLVPTQLLGLFPNSELRNELLKKLELLTLKEQEEKT